MSNVFKIHAGPSKFTLNEARELLPTILKITERHNKTVKRLLVRIENLQGDPNACAELENQFNAEITQWQNKCKALGVEGKGLWLVDFDCGTGYYCWKFPETTLEHWHSYTEGFQARVKIKENAS